MSDENYTTERRTAFVRVVRAARAFVRCVDEFGEDDRAAHGERMEELVNALDAEGRAWDGDSSADMSAHSGRTVREG